MRFFRLVGQSKVYFVGAMVYFNIMNFIMLLLTSNKLYSLGFSTKIVVPVGCIIVAIIGVVDYKFVLKHQLHHYNRKNDVKQQLNRVEDNLIEIRKILAKTIRRNKNAK
jgi:hypothetical protein